MESYSLYELPSTFLFGGNIMGNNTDRLETSTIIAIVVAVSALIVSFFALYYADIACKNFRTLASELQQAYYASPYADPAYQQSSGVQKSYDPGPYEGNCDPSLDPVYQGNAKVGGGANIEEGYDPEMTNPTEEVSKPDLAEEAPSSATAPDSPISTPAPTSDETPNSPSPTTK